MGAKSEKNDPSTIVLIYNENTGIFLMALALLDPRGAKYVL